jgi:hypothetical protein
MVLVMVIDVSVVALEVRELTAVDSGIETDEEEVRAAELRVATEPEEFRKARLPKFPRAGWR